MAGVAVVQRSDQRPRRVARMARRLNGPRRVPLSGCAGYRSRRRSRMPYLHLQDAQRCVCRSGQRNGHSDWRSRVPIFRQSGTGEPRTSEADIGTVALVICSKLYERRLWPSCVHWPCGSLRSTAAVQMAACRNDRTTATGRLPTDAIPRPPAASRRVAVGQVRKLTSPREWRLTADCFNSTSALEKTRRPPLLADCTHHRANDQGKSNLNRAAHQYQQLGA
jgi:hypothetical protein